MSKQKEREKKINVSGHIEIGDLVLTNQNTYNGNFWISRPSGEGMELSEPTLRELVELLEAFYRKHL